MLKWERAMKTIHQNHGVSTIVLSPALSVLRGLTWLYLKGNSVANLACSSPKEDKGISFHKNGTLTEVYKQEIPNSGMLQGRIWVG